MVHCVKCGTENPDDSKFCTKCGAQLYVTRESEHYRRVEKECFGLPHGGVIFGAVIGIIIVLFGFAAILNLMYPVTGRNYSDWVWPAVPILIGILIIVGAIYGMRRRY
jgi:uncharacterized membrane protein YvbJ